MNIAHARSAAAASVLALVLTGCSGGPMDYQDAPASPSAASSPAAPPAASPTGQASTGALPPVLAQSAPTSVRIPTLGVDSELLHLGLRENGSLEVPPTDPGSPASWYDKSPTPGERGPAVLLGHVNEDDGGDGVFAGLRDLQPGDTIEIPREDGTTARFEVSYGEAYAKDDFATQKVYGNTAGSELRLITCDGYDPETGLWDENYVVYATLIA